MDISAGKENLFNGFENTQTKGSLGGNLAGNLKGNLKGGLRGKFSFIATSGKGALGLTGNGQSLSFKGELSKLSAAGATGKTQKAKGIEKFMGFGKLEDINFSHTQNLESAKIDKDDARFFLGLLGTNGVETSVRANAQGEVEAAQNEKTVATSKTLMNLLQKANETNKPIRLDFDNNITLVLRVDAEGKLNAQFFPSDKIAEEYLKNNIPALKQQFEDKEIKYSNISYHNQRNDQNNQNKGKKENNNE